MAKTKKITGTAAAAEMVTIDDVAVAYQELHREKKRLEAQMDKLKERIIAHARTNKGDFGDDFRMRFPCGVYVSLRVSDVLSGSDTAKEQLLLDTGDQFATPRKLDEKAVILDSRGSAELRKHLTKLGLAITQSETYALYGG